MNKEEQARREGMAYAFKIAKERGIGFGKKRLLEFREIFNNKTDCITNPDWSCWDDQIAILKEECGIDTFIRQNE